MPAWPAYLLLFASIPLLVPTLARRLGDRMQPPVERERVAPLDRGRRSRHGRDSRRRDRRVDAARAASRPRRSSRTSRAATSSPRSTSAVELRVERAGAGRRLTWTSGGPWRADVFYRVYRHDGTGEDTECSVSAGVAWYCVLRSEPIATTRDLTFVDESAPADGHVSDRRRNELGRRPRRGGRVRVQPSGRCGRLSRSSSSAMRWARSTFSSVSLEITVE